MTSRIVVGLDGSEDARLALRYAIDEVRRRGDAVIVAIRAIPQPIVYGVDTALVPELHDTAEREARRELQSALWNVPDDVRVEEVVADGSAAAVLIDQSRSADLVVVGSRGLGGFRSLLLGSTSHQVVSHASCPVVVVPGVDRAADASRGEADTTSAV